MKNLIYALALLSVVFLSACSNTDQDPISSNTSVIEKSKVIGFAQPFELHQKFPEVNSSAISWKNDRQGIVISISSSLEIRTGRYLFATIEYVNSKGAVMAFLGDSKARSYYLNGFNEKDISKLNVYYFDEISTGEVTVLPYKEAELFENLPIKGWSDGGNAVKIKSFPFPANMQHLFAQMIGSEGNQLIFLGQPRSEDFDFPKSEKLNLKEIKLFTYVK